MTRQYVGARYVPKFADPIEWDNQRSFEALTIVNYLGASYTSKKPVPAGILPTNNEYWALTGNYNAQVQEYLEEVKKFDGRISATEANITNLLNRPNNRKYICLSDSYGMRHDVNWTTYMENILKAKTISESGRGFLPQGNTFLMSLQTILPTISNPSLITDVVICGGWNDARTIQQGAQIQELQNAMIECYDFVRENFPNATMWVGFIAWQTNYNVQPEVTINSLVQTKKVYEGSRRFGIRCLSSCAYPMRTTWAMDETYFHPNANIGAEDLYYTISGELNGHYGYYKTFSLTKDQLEEASAVTSNFNCYLSVSNDVQICKSNAFTVNGTSSSILTFSAQRCPISPWGGQNVVTCWFTGTINNESYTGFLYGYVENKTRVFKVLTPLGGTDITNITGTLKFWYDTAGDMGQYSV